MFYFYLKNSFGIFPLCSLLIQFIVSSDNNIPTIDPTNINNTSENQTPEENSQNTSCSEPDSGLICGLFDLYIEAPKPTESTERSSCGNTKNIGILLSSSFAIQEGISSSESLSSYILGSLEQRTVSDSRKKGCTSSVNEESNQENSIIKESIPQATSSRTESESNRRETALEIALRRLFPRSYQRRASDVSVPNLSNEEIIPKTKSNQIGEPSSAPSKSNIRIIPSEEKKICDISKEVQQEGEEFSLQNNPAVESTREEIESETCIDNRSIRDYVDSPVESITPPPYFKSEMFEEESNSIQRAIDLRSALDERISQIQVENEQRDIELIEESEGKQQSSIESMPGALNPEVVSGLIGQAPQSEMGSIKSDSNPNLKGGVQPSAVCSSDNPELIQETVQSELQSEPKTAKSDPAAGEETILEEVKLPLGSASTMQEPNSPPVNEAKRSEVKSGSVRIDSKYLSVKDDRVYSFKSIPNRTVYCSDRDSEIYGSGNRPRQLLPGAVAHVNVLKSYQYSSEGRAIKRDSQSAIPPESNPSKTQAGSSFELKSQDRTEKPDILVLRNGRTLEDTPSQIVDKRHDISIDSVINKSEKKLLDETNPKRNGAKKSSSLLCCGMKNSSFFKNKKN